MANVINTRIQLKIDTLTNWNSSTFVPLEGEVCIAKVDTVPGSTLQPTMVKIGDGSKTFTQLDWMSAKAADVYGWAKAAGLTVEDTGSGKFMTDIVWDTAKNALVVTRDDAVNTITAKDVSLVFDKSKGDVKANVNISSNSDNALRLEADGLYVADVTIPTISISDDTAAETPTGDTVNVYKNLTANGHQLIEELVTVPTKAYVDKEVKAAIDKGAVVTGGDAIRIDHVENSTDYKVNVKYESTSAITIFEDGKIKPTLKIDNPGNTVTLEVGGAGLVANVNTSNDGNVKFEKVYGGSSSDPTTIKANVDLSGYQEKGDYKTIQGVVVDPTANGESATFIASISQDANGVITATKKTVEITHDQVTDFDAEVRTLAADEINTIVGGANSADTIGNIKDLIDYVNKNGGEITGLKTDVATANTNASNAVTTANNAATTANEALEKAEEALEGAEGAAASAAAAKASEEAAKASENAAKTSETNAKNSENAAAGSATAAAGSASAAAGSATLAGEKAQAASESADAAAASATQAGNSEDAAAGSAGQAAQSARDAAVSAGEATASATNAFASAGEAAQSKADAEKAKSDAESAKAAAAQSANAASTSAEDAERFADQADASSQAAQGAQAAAGAAKEAAEKAKIDAEAAKGLANAAAGQAQGYADDASEQAASATADAGLANSAKLAAEAAQGKAEGAQSKAEAAQQAAEAAKAAAEASNTSATAIANEAKDLATTASNDAKTAKNTVNALGFDVAEVTEGPTGMSLTLTGVDKSVLFRDTQTITWGYHEDSSSMQAQVNKTGLGLSEIASSGSIYDVKEGTYTSTGEDKAEYLIFNCGTATKLI